MAKQLGVKRVIARVAKVLNIPLFEKVGIDIAVSPKSSAINEVKNDLQENNVDILATVEQGQGEVLEINVVPDFHGKRIMDIKFPARAIIGVIIRRNNMMLDKSEKAAFENILASLYALFMAPQLFGAVKLLTDMIMFFVLFMGQMKI